MPISFKQEIIFVHIPKNAGTAIAENPSIAFSDHGHHFYEYYQSRYPLLWGWYKKFAVVRNPWDRIVSNYEYARMKESYWHSVSGRAQNPLGQSVPHPDLELAQTLNFSDLVKKFRKKPEALKHHGWAAQWPYVMRDKDLVVDKVFKFDDLENSDEFKALVPDLKIKNSTPKKHKNYRDYYDEECQRLVGEIYKEDIDRFGFEF